MTVDTAKDKTGRSDDLLGLIMAHGVHAWSTKEAFRNRSGSVGTLCVALAFRDCVGH